MKYFKNVREVGMLSDRRLLKLETSLKEKIHHTPRDLEGTSRSKATLGQVELLE